MAKKKSKSKAKKDGNAAENLFKAGLLNMYIVALFSADTLQDAEDCDRSINALDRLRDDVNKSNIDDKEYYLNMIQKGIDIAIRDKNEFLNN